MIDEATMGEAALQLLASSTIRRYMREARTLASESGLVDALRLDPAKRLEARGRVATLLAQLVEVQQRTPAELELAIVLCAVGRADAAGGADLLRQATDSASAWIRSLAFRMLALGPASLAEIAEIEARLASKLEGTVVVTSAVDASDRDDPAVFPRAA